MESEAISKIKLSRLRKLKLSKHQAKEGVFVAEGLRLVIEGLVAGFQPDTIAVTLEGEVHLRRAWEAELPTLQIVEDRDFLGISDTVTSQGILAVFDRPRADWEEIWERRRCTIVVADNLRDPGNLGSLIRNCVSFDVDGLLLSKGCVDAYNTKVVRATMGGIFHLPIEEDHDIDGLESLFEDQQMEMLALDLADDAPNALTCELPERFALIVGGETHGISDEWKSPTRIRIPQTGKIDSLNAAMSAGIVLARRFGA